MTSNVTWNKLARITTVMSMGMEVMPYYNTNTGALTRIHFAWQLLGGLMLCIRGDHFQIFDGLSTLTVCLCSCSDSDSVSRFTMPVQCHPSISILISLLHSTPRIWQTEAEQW